jgi:hypothetical protein
MALETDQHGASRPTPPPVGLGAILSEVKAVNAAAALCGRPRWVILAEALAEFEKGRSGGPTPKPQRLRRRRSHGIDFYENAPESTRAFA